MIGFRFIIYIAINVNFNSVNFNSTSECMNELTRNMKDKDSHFHINFIITVEPSKTLNKR